MMALQPTASGAQGTPSRPVWRARWQAKLRHDTRKVNVLERRNIGRRRKMLKAAVTPSSSIEARFALG